MDHNPRCSSVSLIVSVVLILTGLDDEPLLKRRPEVEPPLRSPSALLDELAYNINSIPEYVSYNTDWYPTATGYERIPEPPRESLLKQMMSLIVHLRELLDLPSDTDLSSDPTIAFTGYFVLSVLATIASSWIYGRLSRYAPLLPRCISIGPT
ncbi:hypothetical protein EXIGLDRAFT_394699 [Exidia glandulosa HHB12029]|uniref:Uncharacterized protein n=1 Tax=Exidia glandulosa HHB12029 TaxID=1314781 RepID=A0A165BQD4_EXIGL|nr:hypothetical protein EXIGLDRAFT_394699 [Exidia glandulosa HHB12029]